MCENKDASSQSWLYFCLSKIHLCTHPKKSTLYRRQSQNKARFKLNKGEKCHCSISIQATEEYKSQIYFLPRVYPQSVIAFL